jgi:hypothetical protein
MNYQKSIYSGIAVIAAAGMGVSVAACGASSPSRSSPPSSVTYYQEGYRYAQARISPSEHQILGHAGYGKWCASATAATNELNNAPGGPSSKAANHWVKGCDAYAASDGLSASASPAPAPPAATTPSATQSPPPAQAPSSPASSNPQPSPSAQKSTSVPPGMYAWPGGGYCNIPFNEQYYRQNGVPGVCQPAGSKNMP